MTFDEWHSNPALRADLANQLQSPLWQAALSVLESLSYIENGTNIPSNSISEHAGVVAGRMLGYRKAQQNLLSLAQDPPQITKPVPIETYGVNTSAQATE